MASARCCSNTAGLPVTVARAMRFSRNSTSPDPSAGCRAAGASIRTLPWNVQRLFAQWVAAAGPWPRQVAFARSARTRVLPCESTTSLQIHVPLL